jgi:hypothetical protein
MAPPHGGSSASASSGVNAQAYAAAIAPVVVPPQAWCSTIGPVPAWPSPAQGAVATQVPRPKAVTIPKEFQVAAPSQAQRKQLQKEKAKAVAQGASGSSALPSYDNTQLEESPWNDMTDVVETTPWQGPGASAVQSPPRNLMQAPPHGGSAAVRPFRGAHGIPAPPTTTQGSAAVTRTTPANLAGQDLTSMATRTYDVAGNGATYAAQGRASSACLNDTMAVAYLRGRR